MTNYCDEMNFEKIGIGNSCPCFIIAEIGQNHQGNLENAKELIQLAKKCGVNCVKFQKSSLPHRFTLKTLETPYDSLNSFGSTYGEHRSHLEFTEDQFIELQNFAHQIGIMFTASSMDIPSADFLMRLEVPFIKIGSGDTNNFLLIEHIAKQKKLIVLSTGMQDFSTIRKAYDLIMKYQTQVVLMHCVSTYPTLPDDVNLRVIDLYRTEFPDALIGYSGHEIGINVALAAVALGAKVIEKHFTRDKNQKGTDHQCSLNPREMTNLVTGVREVERALGIPVKTIQPSEELCRLKLGKSIVTTRSLYKGGKLVLSDMAIKVSRPMGMKPQRIHELVGLTLFEDIDEDEPILSKSLGLELLEFNSF